MSDAVTIAIIASIGPTLVAIINLIGQQNIRTKVQKIVKQTDGMHAAIVKATAQASHAEGVKDEKLRVADVAEKRFDSHAEGVKDEKARVANLEEERLNGTE